jgi:adenylosuccinate synthase
VVVHISSLFQEVDTNQDKGLKHIESQLRVSDRAHIVLDLHQEIDGMHEKNLGGRSLGTTKKGIGPTYSSKATRNGLRMCDLVGDWNEFKSRYHRIVGYIRERYPHVELDEEADLKKYFSYRERLQPLITDTVVLLHEARTASPPKRILIEGAQSCLLDIDFGTYPYVTSSNCSVGGVCTGLGLPPSSIQSVYGVVKAYTTRVGDGPFPTEISDTEIGIFLRKEGHEYGVTTGRPRRCGWLDTVLIRYAHMINGFTALCLTKLDVLDKVKEIKIAKNYLHPETGEQIEGFPADLHLLERVQVEYETFKGWCCSTNSCHTFHELPLEAQLYVRRVQELCGVPIHWIGIGPGRESIIDMGSNGVPPTKIVDGSPS